MGYAKDLERWLCGKKCTDTFQKILNKPISKRRVWEDENKYHLETLEPGVYVDVSFKDEMFLGFVIVPTGERFCLKSDLKETAYAETEACKIARAKYPELDVYCDHQDSVTQLNDPKIKYIHRNYNRLAHKVAKGRINEIRQ